MHAKLSRDIPIWEFERHHILAEIEAAAAKRSVFGVG